MLFAVIINIYKGIQFPSIARNCRKGEGVLQKPNDAVPGGMLPVTCRPRKATALKQRDLRDGCVLHDRRKGTVCTLNSTASFILTFCTGDYSLEQIALETALAFGLQPENALQDVITTVWTLQKEELLETGR